MSFDQKTKDRISYFLLAGLFLFCLITGVLGVNFGNHWDEVNILAALDHSSQTGMPIPHWYNYPSMTFNISLATFKVVAFFAEDKPAGQPESDYYHNIVDSMRFRLANRTVFTAVTCLTIFWTFFLVRIWRECNAEALIAAALVGLSWEYAYHARWVAPDTLMMMFGSLAMMLMVIAVKNPEKPRWLWLASIAAGLSLGSKYPAGLFLIPLLITAWQAGKRAERGPSFFKRALACTGLFFATYMVTTPGMFLMPHRFYITVRHEIIHYASGHMGNTVAPFAEHLYLMFSYFALALFSPFGVAAFALFSLVLAGVVWLVKNDKGYALLLLSFPSIYILYFSIQKVMIVRNYLVLLPLLAVFAARGIMWAAESSSRKVKAAPMMIFMVTAIAFFANAVWLADSTLSIRARKLVPEKYKLTACSEFIQSNPDSKFFVSQRILRNAEKEKVDGLFAHLSNVTNSNTRDVDFALFYLSDLKLKSNHYGLISKQFGPKEVNLDYYPTWKGRNRIVVLPASSLKYIIR